MGLTSPALVALLVVAVIATLAGTLWWWPALAAPGLRTVALRIAALAALQISGLGLIFVSVNRSAEFYSSWSDLFGTEHASAAIVAVGSGTGSTIAPVKIISTTALPVPGQRRAAGGRLQAVQVHGQLSGLTAPGYVYLPPQRPRARKAPLPVVVVISDQITSQSAPYGAAQLAATAASQIAAGRLRPVIMVILPATVGGRAGAGDQGCLDVPGGPQAATFFSADLPQAVQSAYQMAAGPPGWAVLGDSSGGYCAVQLAMSSSQVFSVAVAPPAEYTTPPGSGEFGGSPQIRTQDDLLWRLQHEAMQPISVLFAGAGQDRSFLSLVRPPMHATSLQPGTGSLPLAPALDWIGRAIGPQP